ncbi:hypothetical protein LCGC14_1591080 [marine sediment metagenome]|uniref:Uncharacterized protein n=1 Tax=marine sediment metagenome TaxID=412755 RepID=A0A0F9IDV9_9ZZZZ
MKEISFNIEIFRDAINEIFNNFGVDRETFAQFDICVRVIKTILFYYCAAESKDIEFFDNFEYGYTTLATIKKDIDGLKEVVITIICEINHLENDTFLFDMNEGIHSKLGNDKLDKILYIIPNEKLDARKKLKFENKLYNPQYSPSKLKIWDFEDLKPLIEEYSVFVSGLSEIFKDLALRNIFDSDIKKQVEKGNNISNKLLKLIPQIKSGALVLNLGAGVSQSEDMPGWNDLLQNLMVRAIRENKKYFPNSLEDNELDYYAKRIHDQERNYPLIEAEFIKFALFQQFRKKIENALYKKNQEYSDLIKNIVNFCNIYGIKEIITYNYDDLIENLFESNFFKKNVWSIYNNETYRQKIDEINIYHVHGYLPEVKSDIILSELEYYRFLQDNSFWANKIQKKHYGHSHCLLIGLSIKDPNLRRILFNAQQDRFKNKMNQSAFLPHFAFIRKTSKADFLMRRGKGEYLAKSETEEVLTIYHLFKQFTYSQFGINVIWIDSYDEIPIILDELIKNRIRKRGF